MKPFEAETDPKEIVRYHEETKHHYDRYARSAGYMDWENQPNPFRFYKETKVFELPFLKQEFRAAFSDLFERQNNPCQEFTIETVGGMLELSIGLSAWKAAGESQWALRMNPSSGNLHHIKQYRRLTRRCQNQKSTLQHKIPPAFRPGGAGLSTLRLGWKWLGWKLTERQITVELDLWAHVFGRRLM